MITNLFIKKEFPVSREFIYFNAGRMGLLPVSSHQVLSKYYEQQQFINRRNADTTSKAIFSIREKIRKEIAAFIGARKNEIALTQNTCQGIDIILNGLSLKKGSQILTTDHEFIGVYSIIYNIAHRLGLEVKILKLSNSYNYLLDDLDKAINKKTSLLVMSHVTYNTGQRLPVKEICKIAHKKNIPVLIDGAQALGWMNVNMRNLDCDFYASCGHKWMLGPSGTGLLFIQEKWIDKIVPTFIGWASMKKFTRYSDLSFRDEASRFENGTISIGLFAALCKSVDLIKELGLQRIEKKLSHFSMLLKNELTHIKNIALLSPFSRDISSPLVAFNSKNYSLTELQIYLRKRYKIITGVIHESDCIRVSIGLWNTEEDIKKFVWALKQYLRNH